MHSVRGQTEVQPQHDTPNSGNDAGVSLHEDSMARHWCSMCVDCELLEDITVGEELGLKVPKACSKREVAGVLMNYTDCEPVMCKLDGQDCEKRDGT